VLYDGSDQSSGGDSPLAAAAAARSLAHSPGSVASSGGSVCSPAPAAAEADAAEAGVGSYGGSYLPTPEDVGAAVRRISQQPGQLAEAGEGGSSAGSEAPGAPQQQLGQLRAQVQELEGQLAGRSAELERAQQALPLALLPALARLQQQLAAALEGPQLRGAAAEAAAGAQALLAGVCEQLRGAELAGLPLQEAQQARPFLYAPLRSRPESPGASSAAAATASYTRAGDGSPSDTAASSERVPLMGVQPAGSAALSPGAAGACRLPPGSPGAVAALLMQDNALFDEHEAESAPRGGPAPGQEEEEQEQEQAGGPARQLSSMGDALQQELRSYRSDVGLLQQELERKEGQLQESSRALQERLVQVRGRRARARVRPAGGRDAPAASLLPGAGALWRAPELAPTRDDCAPGRCRSWSVTWQGGMRSCSSSSRR
jgi:hypothetical protein